LSVMPIIFKADANLVSVSGHSFARVYHLPATQVAVWSCRGNRREGVNVIPVQYLRRAGEVERVMIKWR